MPVGQFGSKQASPPQGNYGDYRQSNSNRVIKTDSVLTVCEGLHAESFTYVTLNPPTTCEIFQMRKLKHREGE